MSPFYIDASNVPAVGTIFDKDDIVYTYDNNYGFNFNTILRFPL